MKKYFSLFLGLVLAISPLSVAFVQAGPLEDKQAQLQEIQKKVKEREEALAKIRNQRLSLDNQIKLLDKQVEGAQLELQRISLQIDEIGLEKSSVNQDLVDLEERALEQKLVLQKAIQVSYLAHQEGVLEMLVSSGSMATFMTKLEYLDKVQEHISVGIKTLSDLKKQLAVKKQILEDKNKQLDQVKSEKSIQEQSLQIQVDAKTKIMKDLKLTEAQYQQKVNESRAEESAVAGEIASLMKASGKRVIVPGEKKLAWPIPYRTITANFRDADYARTFGLPHNGMDIGCPQGTPVQAPANGMVSKVKDGGEKGVSYLVIDHDNGLSTVYMHLTSFAVSAGAYVVQGQIIGYSGGTPGTHGAGWLTTGPHLHLEVWESGQAKNPLGYLVG